MTPPVFRLPEGATFVGEHGGKIELRVDIPLDGDGFFGRQCPVCEQVFRVFHEDYEALPDEVRLWCVYCGHNDDHSEFLTTQQKDRILRPASDIAQQLVGQMLEKSFGGLSRRTRGSAISLSYRSTPYYPEPLPGIDEERLVRERTCSKCSLRYAVFGDHRFCPVCGPLAPGVVATDVLAAETARLDVLGSLPPESVATLREQGVFERIYVDTIENLVSVVEALASSVFRSNVAGAESIVRGRGNIFQRLNDTADLYRVHLACDLPAVVGVQTWALLEVTWASRHVFGHNDGFVDAQYLARVPAATVSIGQRLTITEASTRQAIDLATSLCDAIASAALPAATPPLP